MFADLLREPGVEERLCLRTGLGFMALHGGSLERGTAEIAEQAAARAGASLYAVLQPEGLRWHIPSKLTDPDASRALSAFLGHVELVVSLHGYGREQLRRTVLIGGANREFAAHAAAALRAALPQYRIVDQLNAIPASLRGLHPDNPVNRARCGGVQIELPTRIRDGSLVTADCDALVSALASLA